MTLSAGAQEALDRAAQLGVTVSAADADDVLVSPADRLAPEVRSMLMAHRWELARFLRNQEAG